MREILFKGDTNEELGITGTPRCTSMYTYVGKYQGKYIKVYTRTAYYYTEAVSVTVLRHPAYILSNTLLQHAPPGPFQYVIVSLWRRKSGTINL